MPGNLPIEIWIVIFAVGILVVRLMFLFGSAFLRAMFRDEEEQNSNQPRGD